jgi:hypothetical protein
MCTSVDEAAPGPSTKVTDLKPMSLAPHSVTLSKRPARDVERIGQPLTRSFHYTNSAMQSAVRVTKAPHVERRRRRSRHDQPLGDGQDEMTRSLSISRVRMRVVTLLATHHHPRRCDQTLMRATILTLTCTSPVARAVRPAQIRVRVAGGIESSESNRCQCAPRGRRACPVLRFLRTSQSGPQMWYT